MRVSFIVLAFSFWLLVPVFLKAQDTIPSGKKEDERAKEFDDMGVAVSPSNLRFNVKPGGTNTQVIRVTNDTKKVNKFQVGVSDFDLDKNGRPITAKSGSARYGLGNWINISPTYFELKPGEVQKINVTIQVPDEEESYRAGWSIVMIDQAIDRKTLQAEDKGNTMAMGVIPTFGFGVYVYQNPPNVKINQVEIQKFIYDNKNDTARSLKIEAKNTGDGIGFCSSYVELTNVNTGKQERLLGKKFTILPAHQRTFSYDLPKSLPKGKYSAVGVVDFGSKEQIEAAEMEFEIP